MLHLPFLNEFLDSRRHVLDGHIGIDSVLVEQVNMVSLQSRERFVSRFPNAFGENLKDHKERGREGC